VNAVWDGPSFDETTDPTANVRAALDSARPADTLAGLYRWMSSEAVRMFALRAAELRGRAAKGNSHAKLDLDTLVARFAHAVRAEWANLPGNLPAEYQTKRPRFNRLFRRGN